MWRSRIKEELIYKAEELSDKAKIPVEEIYSRIAERIPEYEEIIEELKKGKLKSEVYEPYLPDDVIQILKAGERKGVVISSLLSEVGRMKSEIKALRNELKSGIVFPVLYFLSISIASYFLLRSARGRFEGIDLIKNWGTYETVLLVYPFAVGLIVFFFLFVLFRPDLFPLTKGGYRDVEGSFVLNLTKYFYIAGLPMSQVVTYFAESGKGWIGRAFRDAEPSLEGYLNAVEEFLAPEESAVIGAGFKAGRFEEVLSVLSEEKLERAKRSIKTTSKLFFYLGIVLLLVPVGLTFLGYGSLFMQILQGAMSHGVR